MGRVDCRLPVAPRVGSIRCTTFAGRLYEVEEQPGGGAGVRNVERANAITFFENLRGAAVCPRHGFSDRPSLIGPCDALD